MSDHLRVEHSDDEFVLKARDKVGQAKRFGMDGEIKMDETEAEKLAQWVFARQLSEITPDD